MPSKENSCAAESSLSTVEGSTSAPEVASSSPTTTGISWGSLDSWLWPGVEGVCWLRLSVNLCAEASYFWDTVTTGVPACEYQRSSWLRSTLLASGEWKRRKWSFKNQQMTVQPQNLEFSYPIALQLSRKKQQAFSAEQQRKK
mgnify:CR=1 FL=1